MKYFSKAKKLCLIIASIMILQLSMPMSFAFAEQMTGQEHGFEDAGYGKSTTGTAIQAEGYGIQGGEQNLGNIFTSVTLEVDGEEIDKDTTIEINDETRVSLIFAWKLNNDVELKAGDYATIQIPQAFKTHSTPASGILGEYDEGTLIREVGDYTVDENGLLMVVFNEELTDEYDRGGQVGLYLVFNEEVINEDNQQIITFGEPINKEFVITVKPKGDQAAIEKSGAPNGSINPTHINWVIDVNKNFDELTNARVEDTIPAGLELDGLIEVYKLTIGADGKVKSETRYEEKDADGFPVELGEINSAYRLKYKTKIVDYGVDYENKATLWDEEAEIDTSIVKIDKITRGSYIEKSGESNATEDRDATKIKWTIDINKAQDNLSNVTLEDILPAGLTIDENGIKIYKLKPSGNEWVTDGEETFPVAGIENGFSIDFRNIDGQAYRIVFDTDIDYDEFVGEDGEFIKSLDFKNEAILKTTEEGKEPIVIDSDDATVPINRSSLVAKSGKEITDYDGDPRMEWTVEINKAKQTIYGAVFEDIVGTGQELLRDTIKVYNADGTDVSAQFPVASGTGNEFTINFGKIDDTYKIVYETKITGDPNTEGFYTNEAWLRGWLTQDGESGNVGVGPDGKPPILEHFEGKGSPSKFNSYTKSTVNKTVDGISYDEINYEEQTMSWVITVDAIKEKITELTISDYFGPKNEENNSDKSMVFLKDTLKVLKNGTVITTGFTVTPKDNGVGGFELKFTGPLDKAKYEIYFKTSFDPDEVLDKDGKINTTKNYKNNVVFTGKAKDVAGNDKTINVTDDADYNIIETIYNGGKKEGTLRRSERKIDWKIYANALGQNLKGEIPFVITDIIQEGQVFDGESTSIVVRTFSLSTSGGFVDSTSEDDVFEEGAGKDYTFAWNESEKTFTITFAGGVDKPILVEYTTKIEGLSKDKYFNTANVTGKDLEKNYTGEVTYSDYNVFIDKEATNANGNTVYVDDELYWEVNLNKSLSDINNAKFTDTISEGQIYLKNSLKLFKGSNEIDVVEMELAEETEETETNTLTTKKNADGTTTLTLNLGDISDEYTVKYTTVVVVSTGKISNEATLTGYDLTSGNTSKKEYTASQSSWGTGTGTTRGKIEIIKVDAEEYDSGKNKVINKNPAKFELYYYLNNDTTEKFIVTGEEQSTKNGGENGGKIQYGNLPYRTYYLEEVEAPTGYVLTDGEPIEIVLSSTNKEVNLPVENTKIKTDVTGTKKWNGGLSPEIELQLYRDGEAIEGEEYKVKLDGKEEIPWTYTWKNLDKTDIDGNEYEYTVDEVKVPENYKKAVSEDGLTITNTYTSPTAEITARKVWVDGSESKPTIWFKLYRQVGNGDKEAVDVEIKELPNGTTEVTWADLDVTDYYGNEYIYSVQEVNSEGNDFKPEDYVKTENGIEVINKYNSPKDAFAKATKKWVNGPVDRPTVWFKLYRHVEGGTLEEVPEAEIEELSSGITEISWTGLTKTDSNGNPYIFSVKEVNEQGEEFAPANYDKEEEGLTVTNTYVIPKISIIGTKEWSGGPSRKPTIQLQLYRDGEAYDEPVTLEDGETSYTWEDLDETDIDGNEYVYTIDEVEVPRRYRKTILEDGLTIRNRYNPPTRPTDPTEPEEPETPEEPEEPETPEEPEIPEEPEKPMVVPAYGRITINKVDENSMALAGAEFTLYNENNEVLDTAVSDESGRVMFDNLKDGKYFVRETKAPEGYEIETDALTVDVAEGKSYNYRFRNVPSDTEIEDPDIPKGWEKIDDPNVPVDTIVPPTLPDTGSLFNTWMLAVIGFIFILTGIVLFGRRSIRN